MTRQRSSTGCIVLAAGTGSRFGSDKRLAQLEGLPLLERTLNRITPLFSQRLLVLRPGDEVLANRFTPAWQVLFAADADKGMGHSLAAAMGCTRDWEGAVIALGDMPLVSAATFCAIRDAVTADNMVVPWYKGQRGNPVGIGRRWFPELAQLRGDQGARKLLEQQAACVVRMVVEDPGILGDIDSPEALAAVARTIAGTELKDD